MPKPNATPPTYQVDFEPIGKRVEVTPDTTLLEAAQQAGLALASTCGGMRSCGQCRLVVLSGDVSPSTPDEEAILTKLELRRGQRLACNTHVHSNVKVHVPKSSLITSQRLQLAGDFDQLTLDPLVHAYDLKIPPPSLDDPRADLERLTAALPPTLGQPIEAEPAVVRQITTGAREHHWHLTAYLRDAEVVGVVPSGLPPMGLAIDLGTTKIAASLVDLTTGNELAVTGVLNPQIGYGEDVISRLTHVWRNPDGGRTLATMVQETLDNLLAELAEKAGVSRAQVADVCLVGNTAMIHLLLQLPVRQLATSPYVAATNAAIDLKAREVGLATAPGAYLHILPCIGGFVGADHVAMLLASQLDQTKQVALGIDIGTNTEIALVRPEQGFLTSVSCASGPAFEGAHISNGMRAAAGAIEAIELTAAEVHLKTVDNAPAIGLCGSGIIDGVAELRRWNLINQRGRFDREHHRVREGRYGAEFLLVPAEQSGSQRDVVITQKDINEIQLAKGAIRAGLEVLLEATGTTPEDVQTVIIAGAFGSFLQVKNALEMGLLPRLPNARYRQVGNAAVVGARQALLSRRARQRAQQIVNQTNYLELTTYPKFNRRFALGMLFPNDENSKGH
ncbi:MAG: DUF4445 domain-containing protein [Anaerolineae bacterium]|nr:DUF4445 domain-containing protein [Anaerolineae bacterium]